MEAPFSIERNAAASWYRENGCKTLDEVMARIISGTLFDDDSRSAHARIKPNNDQEKFLHHFVRRLKIEVLEMHTKEIITSDEEPLLDLIHGFPGTGKSVMIFWMQALMKQGLGWEHGVHFVCLAFQNSMAAAINGYTIHNWTGIPIRNDDGNACGDKHKQSIKCQALRVIIIDEVSMVSAELFGSLEYVVKGAIRPKGTYKKRRNGEARVFGGVNLVMCADFWQLHPVSGTFIASDPSLAPAGRAQNALSIFWEDNLDSIRTFWELRQLMRCSDKWYNRFLSECRDGNLSINNYCFLHGLPTFTCPCDSCTCNHDVILDPILGAIKSSWKEHFLQSDCNMADVVANTEKVTKNVPMNANDDTEF